MTRRLLLLNGLAALMVAVHHATGYGFNAMFDWTDRYLSVSVPNYDQIGSVPFYINIIIQQLDYFALPAFLFVSGYFISFVALGNQSLLGWNMIKQRVINLLIPFALWSLVFFALFVRRLPANLDEIFDRYYFIPLLIQFYLISPLLVVAAKKNWKLVMAGAAILELGRFGLHFIGKLGLDFPGHDFLVFWTPRWVFPMLFFWFVLGMVAGLHRDSFARWLSRYKWHFLAALIIFGVLSIFEYQWFSRLLGEGWLGPYFGGISRQIYALAFILCFLAFDEVSIPFSKQISELGSKSLGIYLVHSRVMYVVAVLMYRQTPLVLGNQFFYQLILILSALGGSLLLMEIFRRTPARQVYRYVFG